MPTELEWEWFARGGEVAIQDGTFDTRYAGSNNIGEVAWYSDNSGEETRIVGTKKPNELGLYDCSGNLWEWCYDTNTSGYINYIYGSIYDSSKKNKILRGGSWCNSSTGCKLSSRSSYSHVNSNIGFRVVRTV